MKTAIWISYDLGVRGDYEGLYAFLDSLDAKECGDSAAYLKFEYDHDLVAELKATLEERVSLDRRARIYVVFPGETGKYRGRFVIGRRKRSPWSGYAGEESEEVDEVE
ncbi:MAG: hypothetical protein J5I93_07430 [Pirellulaceae bacterium]|nr:hypothetical protein [Pirellulaceae bacterium]